MQKPCLHRYYFLSFATVSVRYLLHVLKMDFTDWFVYFWLQIFSPEGLIFRQSMLWSTLIFLRILKLIFTGYGDDLNIIMILYLVVYAEIVHVFLGYRNILFCLKLISGWPIWTIWSPWAGSEFNYLWGPLQPVCRIFLSCFCKCDCFSFHICS